MLSDVDYRYQLYNDLCFEKSRKLIDLGRYASLMKVISERRMNVTELSKASGIRLDVVRAMIVELERSGYVMRIFGGNARYTVLTEKGKEILRRLKE